MSNYCRLSSCGNVNFIRMNYVNSDWYSAYVIAWNSIGERAKQWSGSVRKVKIRQKINHEIPQNDCSLLLCNIFYVTIKYEIKRCYIYTMHIFKKWIICNPWTFFYLHSVLYIVIILQITFTFMQRHIDRFLLWRRDCN